MVMDKVILYTDGGSRGNPGLAGAGAFICNEQGVAIKRAFIFLGTMTNNEAEYQAVLLGLDSLRKTFGKDKLRQIQIELRLDSELVCKQLKGEYQVKEEKLVPLFMKIWNARVADFPNIIFKHIPRAQNAEADKLANQAMDGGERREQATFRF